MLNAKAQKALLLLTAPATALGLSTFLHWRGVDENVTPTIAGALATTGALSSVLAFLFAADAQRLRRALGHLRKGGGALGGLSPRDEEKEHERRAQVSRLQREVDRLSAVRDLALVANDDVDTERVLEKALTVIENLTEAHDIRMFLAKEGGGLEAIALRTKGKTRVRKPGDDPIEIVPRRAKQALATKRRFAELGTVNLSVATLLVADGALIGALEVTIARRSRDAAWAREVEEDLDLLAKHVSLAIRKPALYDRAVSDGLTGLGTKRHFLETTRTLMAQARRIGTPLSIVVLDIDHFKKVNDTYGHVAGDLVLKETARRLRQTIRGYDMGFRYGGEELIILAPNTKLDEAQALAERLRKTIAADPVNAIDKQIPVTGSLGVACFEPSMTTVEQLVEAADQHLYVAKRNGRNQVQPPLSGQAPPAVAPPEETPVAPATETQSVERVEAAPPPPPTTEIQSPVVPVKRRAIKKHGLVEGLEPAGVTLPEAPSPTDW